MTMRLSLLGLILSFCVSTRTAESRPEETTHARPGTPLIIHNDVPPTVVHPSPIRAYTAWGEEPTSPERIALPPHNTSPQGVLHGELSPFKALRIDGALPGSIDTSPKRIKYDDNAEVIPQESTSLPAVKKLDFNMSEHRRPASALAGRATAPVGHKSGRLSECHSAFSDKGLPHTPTTPETKSPFTFTRRLSTRVSDSSLGHSANASPFFLAATQAHRASSSPIKAATLPPLPPTPGSPAPKAWAEGPSPLKKPVQLSKLELTLDFDNPRSIAIEWEALTQEARALRNAITESPIHSETTQKLQERWEQINTFKHSLLEHFREKALRHFAPLIENLERKIQEHQATPTYVGAAEMYNLLAPLQTVMEALSGSELKDHLLSMPNQIAACSTAAQALEQAAGAIHQHALQPLLQSSYRQGEFQEFLTANKDALNRFTADAQAAHQTAQSEAIKQGFSALVQNTTEYLHQVCEDGKPSLSRRQTLASLQALNPGPSWSEIGHTLFHGPITYIKSFGRTDVHFSPHHRDIRPQSAAPKPASKRSLRLSSSSVDGDHHPAQRTRYGSESQASDSDGEFDV